MGSPASVFEHHTQVDSHTHLDLGTLGMNIIKITEMECFLFTKQHGVLDFTQFSLMIVAVRVYILK